MRKEGLHRIVALVLVGVFVLLAFNRIFFIHSHKLANGVVIVHAHPFDKSHDQKPFKSHVHTPGELFFLAHSELLYISAVCSVLLLGLILIRKLRILEERFIASSYRNTQSSRAPPSGL